MTDGRAASGGRPPGVSLGWCSGGAASGGRAPSNLGGSCAGRPLRAGPAERWAAPSVPAAAPWCCVVLSVGGFAPVFSAAGAGGRKAPRRQVGDAPAGAGGSARCGGRGKTGPHGGPEGNPTIPQSPSVTAPFTQGGL